MNLNDIFKNDGLNTGTGMVDEQQGFANVKSPDPGMWGNAAQGMPVLPQHMARPRPPMGQPPMGGGQLGPMGQPAPQAGLMRQLAMMQPQGGMGGGGMPPMGGRGGY
jgi:hypothetical protein